MLIREILEKHDLKPEQIKKFVDVLESVSKTKETKELEEFFADNFSLLDEKEFNSFYETVKEECLNDSFSLVEKEDILSAKIIILEEKLEEINKKLEEGMKKKYMEQACPYCGEQKMYADDGDYICEACKKKSVMKEGKLMKIESKKDVKESVEFKKGLEDHEKGEYDNNLILESEDYREGIKEAKRLKEAAEKSPVTVSEFREMITNLSESIKSISEKIDSLEEKIEKTEEAETEETNEKEDINLDSINEAIEKIYEGNLYESLKEKGFKEIFEEINEKAKEELEEKEYKALILSLVEEARENGEEIDILEFVDEEKGEDSKSEEVDEEKGEDSKSEEVDEEKIAIEEKCNDIIENAISELVETDKAKIKELAETIEFETLEELEESLKNLIENLDNNKKEEKPTPLNRYEKLYGIRRK